MMLFRLVLIDDVVSTTTARVKNLEGRNLSLILKYTYDFIVNWYTTSLP